LNRGTVFAQLGKGELALDDYTKVIGLNPNHAGAYNNRGILYATSGNFGLAVSDYTMAIELKPDYAKAHNNFALLLATCPNEKYRDGEKAVSIARRSCELLGWDNPSVLDTLSVVLCGAWSVRRGDQVADQGH
jgi:Flp pilus assembly protein TadD